MKKLKDAMANLIGKIEEIALQAGKGFLERKLAEVVAQTKLSARAEINRLLNDVLAKESLLVQAVGKDKIAELEATLGNSVDLMIENIAEEILNKVI
jgi:hypothetical protein